MRVSRKRPVARRGKMMVWKASSSTAKKQNNAGNKSENSHRSSCIEACNRLLRAPIHCVLDAIGNRGLSMNELGKMLLGLGLLLAVIGAVLLLDGRVGVPLGRLPGDFAYKGKSFSVYFPLGTCILISVVLSAALYLFSRFRH